MIHARDDYSRFQDPALDDPSLLGEGCSPIGEDEPVFLLRAKDIYFVSMLLAYRDNFLNDFEMYAAITAHVDRAQEWRERNETKFPDMPKRKKGGG